MSHLAAHVVVPSSGSHMQGGHVRPASSEPASHSAAQLGLHTTQRTDLLAAPATADKKGITVFPTIRSIVLD